MRSILLIFHSVGALPYSKTFLQRQLKIDKTKILMEKGSLTKVESIAECSHSAILLTCIKRDNRYWKPIFRVLFEWPLKTGFTVCQNSLNVETSYVHRQYDKILYRPDLTIAVDWDVKHQNKQENQVFCFELHPVKDNNLKYNFTGLISIKWRIRKKMSAFKAHLL